MRSAKRSPSAMERERLRRGGPIRLIEIGRHCAALSDTDTRSPDEILGYDSALVAILLAEPDADPRQSRACLLAARGRAQRLSQSGRQLIVSPRRQQSRKLDEVYQRIDALVLAYRPVG